MNDDKLREAIEALRWGPYFPDDTEAKELRAEIRRLRHGIADCAALAAQGAPPDPKAERNAYQAECSASAVQRQDGSTEKLRHWMRSNMTFYNTAESTGPVLASVSKRIWYHATDDMESYPFDSVIDAALVENAADSHEARGPDDQTETGRS